MESATHMNDRLSGPFPDQVPGEEWWNEGGTFAYWARNKKSLCLDVTHPQGKEVFLKLVAHSDIVTDNFRPGTMQRLGLDHDSLARCAGYHHAELYGLWPHRSLARYGARARTVDVASRRSRAMKASSPGQQQLYGPLGGLNVAYALLLALYQRRKTGTGMRLDLSMYETGVSCIAPALLETQRGMTVRVSARPTCGRHRTMSIPARALTAGLPYMGIGRPVAHPVSRHGRAGLGHGDALCHHPGPLAAPPRPRCPPGPVDGDPRRPGVDASVAGARSASGDRAYRARPGSGPTPARTGLSGGLYQRQRTVSWPARVCRAAFRTLPDAPLALHLVSALGQHNVEILRDVAALSEAEIQGLVEAGVLAAQPDTTRPAPGATAYQAGDLRGDPHYRAAVQALVDAVHQPSDNRQPAGKGGNRAGIVR